ncbi:MAG: hypothetical protein OSB34_03440 [Planktomarina sp.]|nr:hypothetical protein [Planktomarina sp.]HAG72673.1 hypothetical protein [Gammaproteobacteria bacterium]|tara:strand:+ start:434 stop:844 length:411 start_codon:yes stop_codon:yes gene_type:complete
MSFSEAFLLPTNTTSPFSTIGSHVDYLMQAVAPGPAVKSALENVQSSNLCYGVFMNLAVNDQERQQSIVRILRQKLERFEPRLGRVKKITMKEDKAGNLVEFDIDAEVIIDGAMTELNLETCLSLLDQKIEENSKI